MKKQRIGITGATGFIGRHLINKLLKDDYQIIAFCRERKHELPLKVKIVNGDLRSGYGLKSFLKNCDILIHLAARVLPPEKEMYQDNVVATKNLLKNAKKFPIQQIIFMSSVAVYGESKEKIFKESDKCQPNTEYGRTKLLSEEIIHDWQKETGGISTIFRPFNIYGPGNYKGIIYEFYKSIKDKGKLVIYGDGKQSRDFLYIDDAVDIMSMLIQKKKAGIFNIGNGEKYTVMDVAKTFEKVMDRKINVTFGAAESAKVFSIECSLSAIRKEFNWKAKIRLFEGIKRTLKWYEDNFK